MKQLSITNQVTGDSFSFYNNYLGTILRSFEGFEYASVKASIDDVSGPYGSVYVNSKFGTRSFSFTGDLVSENVFALRRTLSQVLRQTGTIKLLKFTTYDDLDLQAEVEVTKVTFPYNHSVHTFLIQMIAPDWRFYSQELKSQNVSRVALLGGAEIPATIPMSLPLIQQADTELNRIVLNEGNEDTDPIFTITGPGNIFTAINDTTGKQFEINYSIGIGDIIVIDVKNRTVLLNGVTNLYPYFSGDFWSVAPQENQLTFLVNTDFTTETILTAQFRDAYSGI